MVLFNFFPPPLIQFGKIIKYFFLLLIFILFSFCREYLNNLNVSRVFSSLVVEFSFFFPIYHIIPIMIITSVFGIDIPPFVSSLFENSTFYTYGKLVVPSRSGLNEPFSRFKPRTNVLL